MRGGTGRQHGALLIFDEGITGFRRDITNLLQQFLLERLREGLNLIPDGRVYVSAVHSQADTEQTVSAIDRAFARLDQK